MTDAATDAPLRFALIGAGFWAEYQLAAWLDAPGADCVAIVDSDLSRAKALAARFEVPAAYGSIEDLFRQERVQFVDIVSSLESHVPLVEAAARHGVHAICQKPLAASLKAAQSIVRNCEAAGVQLSVHENWRWQRPIRAVKALLDENPIGRVFRARLDYNNSFPVFDNQPGLKELEEFILFDMGTHLFDVLRFLFGEPVRLACEINRSRPDIRGEDVASVLMRMTAGATVLCNMSYGSRLEHDRFPETLLLIEGEQGSIAIDHDCWVSVTTSKATARHRHPPLSYPWADSRYELVHSSIVDCHRHLLAALRSGTEAETSGRDNLKTLAMIEAAYQSARLHQVVELSQVGLDAATEH